MHTGLRHVADAIAKLDTIRFDIEFLQRTASAIFVSTFHEQDTSAKLHRRGRSNALNELPIARTRRNITRISLARLGATARQCKP